MTKFLDRTIVPVVYHISIDQTGRAACDSFEEGDTIVPYSEVMDPNGRHFNCPDCSWVMHGFKKRPTPTGDVDD